MKKELSKIFKSLFVIVAITVLCFGTIVIAESINAGEIIFSSFKTSKTNVKDALDELYTIADSGISFKNICKLIDGTFEQIGSKYECDPGDGIKRNFYILSKNVNSVELIMEHNITEGSNKTLMNWYDAMNYIDTNNLKSSWKYVLNVDLPGAQTIANAVGNSEWKMTLKNHDDLFYFDSKNQTPVANASNLSSYRWLYNYTRDCKEYGCDASTSLSETEAYGYWTKDSVSVQNDSVGYAWRVHMRGNLNSRELDYAVTSGVRPVITILRSNLYK